MKSETEKKKARMTLRDAVDLAAPHTWAASVMPALFGIVYCLTAGIRMDAFFAAALFAACVLMQSAVNVINDYFDFIKGTDSKEDNLEEHDAVLVYRNIDPFDALVLFFVFMGLAFAVGVWAFFRVGAAPLFVGLAGGIIVLLYSGGPKPLSYLPVGELASGFVMGGLIPLGIYAAVTGKIYLPILLSSLPMICSIGLIMMSNNGCDIEKDIIAGRKTLPVVLGREKTRTLFRLVSIVWLLSAALFPVIRYGLYGLSGMVLMLIFGRKTAAFLMHPPLTQEQRITQMKMTLKANILFNAIYIISTATGAIIHAVR